MIHLAFRTLRHDLLTFGFSVLPWVLIFAFLLLIPLSGDHPLRTGGWLATE
jgi:hypothetical protein